MKSGQCPKCGQKDIRVARVYAKDVLVVSLFSVAQRVNYVCANCGYVEAYVSSNDLSKLQKLPSAERDVSGLTSSAAPPRAASPDQ